MIGREKRVLLRHYLEQGMNKAVIARDLGVSRRTVYHWIETGQLDRELDEERVGYGPRCLMPSKLDPYKPLIDTRLKENPEFMRYAYHWNFRIRACRPYRAQTKGKVERPIRYLRESFFYGRTFTSDDDLNAQALHWLETEANVRSHATLKERPLDRFERERLLLEPLATRPYHPLVLPPDRSSPGTTSLPAIHVERRPLTAYAQIAGGDR